MAIQRFPSLVLPTLILLVIHSISQAAAQSSTPIPWSEYVAKLPQYWDLRHCAQNCLIDSDSCLSYPSNCPLANRTSVDGYLDCENLSCMCTPDALRNGKGWVENCALTACENSVVDANAIVNVCMRAGSESSELCRSTLRSLAYSPTVSAAALTPVLSSNATLSVPTSNNLTSPSPPITTPRATRTSPTAIPPSSHALSPKGGPIFSPRLRIGLLTVAAVLCSVTTSAIWIWSEWKLKQMREQPNGNWSKWDRFLRVPQSL
ncbi:hypothetical protein K469DRAFT_753653 [Zopfia rhizophila CBS 207.26]|uniref:Extracellular membrane protein CFEM domain-containing protein n=1 Tax=Zopfia rhizophila CBS 207.26 TaxID=1314779 RepID=A0A6A6DQP0_9PEZI|nr:hypothetical protein K469DRAFT_753653 [Zopfia rhizophila CBS 207.26]